jgi:hypothetical protein
MVCLRDPQSSHSERKRVSVGFTESLSNGTGPFRLEGLLCGFCRHPIPPSCPVRKTCRVATYRRTRIGKINRVRHQNETDKTPDFEWYSTQGGRLGLKSPRCLFASVHACPCYYQSLSQPGGAGCTAIPKAEEDALKSKSEKHPLWPLLANKRLPFSEVMAKTMRLQILLRSDL